MIQIGNTIKVHYTGKLINGEEFDSSVGREPLEFTTGSRQVIPGFENAILGKQVGDKVSVNIPVDQAYGEIDENMIQEVPNEMLQGQVFEVGQFLQVMTSHGPINVRVKEVNETNIVIDGNHPLAGEELQFDIEVMEIM